MRIVKWGSVTICKTNVLKDTILNFLKIVTKITLGIPSVLPLNQNVTMNINNFLTKLVSSNKAYVNTSWTLVYSIISNFVIGI